MESKYAALEKTKNSKYRSSPREHDFDSCHISQDFKEVVHEDYVHS